MNAKTYWLEKWKMLKCMSTDCPDYICEMCRYDYDDEILKQTSLRKIIHKANMEVLE